MVNKIPFPDFLLKTPCEIKLLEDKVTEDGDKKIYQNGIKCNCIYSEATKRVYSKDGKTTVLSSKVIVKGDIAPKLKSISGGTIVIDKKEMTIYSAARPRNPDGTVHHTEFELL